MTAIHFFSTHASNLYTLISKIEKLRNLRACERLGRAEDASGVHLTNRERELAELLFLRLSAGEIASVLRISRRTVEKHIYDLYARLRVYDSRGLLRALMKRREAMS